MNSDLSNSLWFTGSTIAQTLSGSMGLLGAIMLFALQETSRSIQKAAEELTETPHESMNASFIRHLLTRRSYHELARLYGQQLSATMGETSMDLLVHHSTLTWELEHDTKLRKAFWEALLASGFVIAFGIATCGLAPRIAENEHMGWAILGILVVSAIGCLVLYGILLRILFRATPKEIDTGKAAGQAL